ncbi:hypothetical protein DL93DRAFT_2050327 [Clavulina sp. PMI_390]|nr:hypothetical protein DL93DRAFT_2050327 [Clavulina sp. PMI_390]
MSTSAPGRGGAARPGPPQRRTDASEPSTSKVAAARVDPHRKKILLMGHKRSGKTACKEVAFHGMTAKETFLLEPTRKVTKENLDVLIPIQVWDCPANYPVENLPLLLGAFFTIIYVIDIQDDYGAPIHLLLQLMAQIYVETKDQARPLNLEVYVHKADGMSDDYKLEYFRHLQERILEGCLDHEKPIQNITPTYHLTSAYDHTLFEAWSRTIQKLIDPLGPLDNLMNVLCSNSSIMKAFLFDTKTLIHVASDDSPPDASIYGLCCEYVQTIMQFSDLYRYALSPLSIY